MASSSFVFKEDFQQWHWFDWLHCKLNEIANIGYIVNTLDPTTGDAEGILGSLYYQTGDLQEVIEGRYRWPYG